MSNTLSYRQRSEFCTVPLAKQIFQLLDEKKTNLCLSADVTSSEELLALADQLGPEICIFKTHIDIVSDFTFNVITKLRELAKKHSFWLFEDRKFADIGNTVKQQYAGGIYRIAEWAHLVNAHTVVGPGVLKGLAEAALENETGFLLIAELSSQGHLMTEDYAQQTLQLAKQFPEHVIGFITQSRHSNEPQWINFTPGVQLDANKDGLGQQYKTPEKAILEQGADIIITGRGIITAKDPVQAAREYRERGFQAYLQRTQYNLSC